MTGGFRHLPGRAMNGVRRLATSPWGLTLSVVALCQAIIAALLIYVLLDYKSYQECLAAWQTASSSSQVARAIVAEETDAAMDDVVFAVGESDRQAFRAAVQRYIEVRKNQQEERLKNPIPPSPTEVCGGAG